MRIQKRGARWRVEVYDPSRPSKRWSLGTHDTEREAKDAGRRAELVVSARRGQRGDETVLGWSERWLDLFPRQKATTNAGYREQIKPFVNRYGSLQLREVGVELAVGWVREHRWTHGGIRAMFSDARRLGLVERNPFTELRQTKSRGRKDLDVLSFSQVERLADCAVEVWDGEAALTVRTLIMCAAFIGMRPAELYGLRWSDLDMRTDEVRVERQYSAKSRSFELPKNGRPRVVVLTPPAKTALLTMPRPLDAEQLIFRGSRGGALTGRTQHYYWHPVRCLFGRPSMDLYELRHFCGSWLLNDLELPPQDVAHQLGHTDGGALVMRLYGHPSERLARDRIKRATGATPAAVSRISEPIRSQSG